MINIQKKQRIYLFDQVPFDQITQEKLLHVVITWAKTYQKKKVFNMNTHGVVTFLQSTLYAAAMEKADLIYPDGWGPVWATQLEHIHLKKRINVGDFISNLLQSAEKAQLKIYLIGCEDKIAELTAQVIKQSYPMLSVVGFHSVFFTSKEERTLLKDIKKKKPNLVLVGMGIPHQELWLEKNWPKLPSAVYMGVGGVFYYVTKIKSRAPIWMRQNGMEWFYRLLQEPTRLAKRYTLYNFLFLQQIIIYKFFKGR